MRVHDKLPFSNQCERQSTINLRISLFEFYSNRLISNDFKKNSETENQDNTIERERTVQDVNMLFI